MMASSKSTIYTPRSYRLHSLLISSLIYFIFSIFNAIDVQAYVLTVDAGIENECFHERVPIGTKLGFSFEVIEGGFYDIDVVIKDPSNVVLHQEDRATNGKYTIEATVDGPYYFCFNNIKSSHTPKTIIFDIDRANVSKFDEGTGKDPKDEENQKLIKMVNGLTMSTITARHDVRYLTARDRVHKKISEATNSTLVWWSCIEFVLLLCVTLGQVYYLRRFFEVRRKA